MRTQPIHQELISHTLQHDHVPAPVVPFDSSCGVTPLRVSFELVR